MQLEQAVSDAEEHTIVLLLSLRKLRARFCLDPYIPSGKLVAAIGFKARGKGTGKEGRKAEFRQRLQLPVFLFGKGLVRQEEIQHEKTADEHGKESGNDSVGRF